MSATNTGTPGGRELLGQQLERLGLAGAGRSGDQPVPVHHREWNPDFGLRGDGGAFECGSQDDGRIGEAVAGLKHVGERHMGHM